MARRVHRGSLLCDINGERPLLPEYTTDHALEAVKPREAWGLLVLLLQISRDYQGFERCRFRPCQSRRMRSVGMMLTPTAQSHSPLAFRCPNSKASLQGFRLLDPGHTVARLLFPRGNVSACRIN